MMTCPSESAKAKAKLFKLFPVSYKIPDLKVVFECWIDGVFIGWIQFENGGWKVLNRADRNTTEKRPATDEEIAAVTAFLLTQ